MKGKLIAIVGPTACGKTELSIKLAKKFSGEIICADSRTFYKGMDIGTAKPTFQQQREVPHHFLNILYPNQDFTVAQFQKLAYKMIGEIWLRGKIPFLVGGSGLYIDAVLYGLEIPPVSPNKKLREKLEKESTQKLFKWLKKLDPESAQKIDPNNKRRITRALEVCLVTSRPFSEYQKKEKPDFDFLILGIELPRKELYQRIDQRVEEMIKEGLVEEVQKLVGLYPITLPVFSGIGYQEIIDYLRGKISLASAVERIKYHSHSFARRQISWFGKNSDIKWIKTYSQAEELIGNFLNI